MNRENRVWLIIFAIGGALLVARGFVGQGLGKEYYEVKPDGTTVSVTKAQYERRVELGEAADELPSFGLTRTLGLWVSAFFTLAMLSFLYRDNPFYKIAEHAFVGISAAYWMVMAFWSTLVPNLFGKLWPRFIKGTANSGLDLDQAVEDLSENSPIRWLVDYQGAHGDGLGASWLQLMDVWYWIPLALGVMLLWRLAPKGQWISRWALAFILGYTAGIRLVAHLASDFVLQISSTISGFIPLPPDGVIAAPDFGQQFYFWMNNIIILLGVLCGLTYFFFSLEHKGVVGKVSRVGIWVLMITFGAGFGFTVMGRVALLVGRFEFLVIDWLAVVPAG